MPVTAIKVLELVGHSQDGWQHAAEAAVSEATKMVSGVRGVEVYNMTADVHNGRIVGYKANVKIVYTD